MNQPISTVIHPVFNNRPSVPMAVETTERGVALKLAAWFLLHLALGATMKLSSEIATVHAIVAAAVGLWFAVSGGRLERVFYAGAYIVTAEALWRLAGAQIFWEFGKYALAAIFLVALVRNGLYRSSMLPLAFFMLLLPSCVIPMMYLDSSTFRAQISFNLSGPFALAVSVWFLSQVRLTSAQLYKGFFTLIGPALSVAGAAAFNVMSADVINFGRESNKLTSGGFGPNQVSATMGLALLFCLLYLATQYKEKKIKIVILVALIWLGAQSALTFSRTGLYSAGLSMLMAGLYLTRDRRARFQLIAASLIIFVVSYWVIFPALDKFTGGAIVTRFQDTSSTGRLDILGTDIALWGQNPIFGVGPGMATEKREELISRAIAAHTEFSRLVSEHGLFGFIALILLFVMGWQHLRQARTPLHKALVVALLCWTGIFMFTTAMRLAAPAFIFGLTAVVWLPPTAPSESQESEWRG